MADKNYLSLEERLGEIIVVGDLTPDSPDFDDTLKVWKCVGCEIKGGTIQGSREDCIDIGRESHRNTFRKLQLYSNGEYCVTLKGGSDDNEFQNITVGRHGSVVDIEIGNWHSYNFERSTGTRFVGPIRASDGKPVTYCYRLGCRPTIVEGGVNVKHLWWRSIGLTVYWWVKYVWHALLKRQDRAVA